MSFATPRNVPNFDAATARAREDTQWKPSSSGRYYKDKPYDNVPTKAQKRRKVLILSAFLLAFFYFAYHIGRSNDSLGKWQKTNKELSTKEKQDSIRKAFVKSWAGYKKYAWGKDEYHPISKGGRNMGPKPLGWIIVDSLDTMHIMGLKNELAEAREWVDKELTYDMDYNVNTFETSIRMLGGLLSAHYLTTDDMYLDKAADLGNRLMGAFDSGSGVPYASVNLKTGKGVISHADAGASSTAEAATVQLEFKYLAKLTGEQLYWKKAEQVLKIMDDNHPRDGLVPIFIQPESGRFQGELIRMGSRGDSYYEYLIKQYLQTNREEPVYKQMYDESVRGIKKHLIEQSHPSKLTYIAELDHGIGGGTSPKMDHLVCFASGMLAIGATNGISVDQARRLSWTTDQEADMQLARELARTCVQTYEQTAVGLAPEIVIFNQDKTVNQDFKIKLLDAHNLQRPETLESLFVLWRITKNPIYREWGWKIFQAFEKYTLLEGDAGYTSLQNVKEIPPELRDNMESFWLGETLKYLYLLFDDNEDLLPLDSNVFSTEGHPFPVFSLGHQFKTGWSRSKA